MKIAAALFVMLMGVNVASADPGRREARAEMRAERHQEMLAMFDRNHDGRLDAGERRAAIRQMRRMERRLVREARHERREERRERRADRRGQAPGVDVRVDVAPPAE